MKKHWTERLFIEKPSFFRTALEDLIERANAQVTGLIKIFSEFQVFESSLILDLCCGIGRHSVVLAERGFKVVGVDFAPVFIAHAKEMAAERNVSENVEFRVGDMREIREVLKDYDEKFNAVINLTTSIGYYDEATDGDVLMQLLGLTASNGILVIDITNRDWIIRHFQARDVNHIGDDLVQVIERRLNLENSRMENMWKYFRKKGQDLKYLDTIEVHHRVYSLHELKKLVEESGWTYQTCYGGLNLEPLTMDSNRMVLVAKKPLH